MKIAIDIDEVLVEQLGSVVEFYRKESGIFVSKDDFLTYNWKDVWGCSLEEAISVYRRFIESDFYDNMELVSGSVEGVREISGDNDLIVITSRDVNYKDRTLSWLKENFGDSFDEVHYSSDFHEENKGLSKGGLCCKLGVDVMVEDNLDYSLDCAKSGIEVVLLNRPWNHGEGHANIYRCFSWDEAVGKIKEIGNGR